MTQALIISPQHIIRSSSRAWTDKLLSLQGIDQSIRGIRLAFPPMAETTGWAGWKLLAPKPAVYFLVSLARLFRVHVAPNFVLIIFIVKILPVPVPHLTLILAVSSRPDLAWSSAQTKTFKKLYFAASRFNHHFGESAARLKPRPCESGRLPPGG